MDIIMNLLIFAITLVIVVLFFRKDGHWAPDRGKFAFRFFTCQSNVLCAVAALLMASAQLAGYVPRWIWTLKYAATAAVTVTMLTVFFYLWPAIGKDGPKQLLSGKDLFLHLITPLLAIISFCLLEKRGMSFSRSLWGLLPTALYGLLYLYRVIYAPEDKKWEDYYGFNKQGKWPAAFVMMLAGTFAICMLFMIVQNS